MFDIVRRRKYVERRVLIDSARILDSPFDDSLICLSGAELELLRNVCLYLRRQDSFVASYFAQHYLTPDRTDWDALQAVVAGLEEKLMGCAELETMIEALVTLTTPIMTNYKVSWAAGPGGSEVKYITAPGVGVFRKVYRIMFWNGTRIAGDCSIGYHKTAGNTTVKKFTPTAQGEIMTLAEPFTLAYPDSVYVVITGCSEGDACGLLAFQEDVDVPA